MAREFRSELATCFFNFIVYPIGTKIDGNELSNVYEKIKSQYCKNFTPFCVSVSHSGCYDFLKIEVHFSFYVSPALMRGKVKRVADDSLGFADLELCHFINIGH